MASGSPPVSDGARPDRAMPGLVPWAGAAAAMVGLFDAGWAVWRSAAPLSPGAQLSLIAAGATVLVIPASVLALMVFGAARLLARTALPLRARRAWARPRVRGGLLAGVVLSLSVLWWLADERGLDWRTIDFRAFVFSIAGVAMAVAAARRFPLSPRGALASASAGVLVSTCGAAVALGAMPGLEGALQTASTQTLTLRRVMEVVRVAQDGDGDGYAGVLCRDDCDCDDTAEAINPGAVEIPGDGIDQNCTAGDLERPPPPPPVAEAEAEAQAAVDPVMLAPVHPPYPIVLITIDTLRADHVSSYGYPRLTTPALDELAETSTRFVQARAQGPATRYSIPALLTGRFFSTLPRELHGKWCRLLPENETFAELLHAAGYASRAVMTYLRFSPQSGFGQGFDVWDTSIYELRSATKNPSAHRVTDVGLAHLDELRARPGPWLLWLHYFDPHSEYLEHPRMDGFGREDLDLYDGEIAFTDHHVGRFFDGLRERGLWDEVAIIVTSDHGEGFGTAADHGSILHGHSLYDTEVRVPMFVRVPGVPARVVDASVGLIDVAPTILELAGLGVPDSMHGHSLLPWLRGGHGHRGPVFLERPGDIQPNPADPFACHEGACGPLMGLIEWPYKLHWDVRHNRFELYDLVADPGETIDLASTEPERVAKLARALELLRYEMGPVDAG